MNTSAKNKTEVTQATQASLHILKYSIILSVSLTTFI